MMVGWETNNVNSIGNHDECLPPAAKSSTRTFRKANDEWHVQFNWLLSAVSLLWQHILCSTISFVYFACFLFHRMSAVHSTPFFHSSFFMDVLNKITLKIMNNFFVQQSFFVFADKSEKFTRSIAFGFELIMSL